MQSDESVTLVSVDEKLSDMENLISELMRMVTMLKTQVRISEGRG